MRQPDLEDGEAVLDVEEVGLSDEHELGDVPAPECGCGPACGPVAEAHEGDEQAAEDGRLLQEGVLLGVVATVLHEVADHIGVAPVVQTDRSLLGNNCDRSVAYSKKVKGFVDWVS